MVYNYDLRLPSTLLVIICRIISWRPHLDAIWTIYASRHSSWSGWRSRRRKLRISAFSSFQLFGHLLIQRVWHFCRSQMYLGCFLHSVHSFPSGSTVGIANVHHLVTCHKRSTTWLFHLFVHGNNANRGTKFSIASGCLLSIKTQKRREPQRWFVYFITI